jgi:hypothetical protein
MNKEAGNNTLAKAHTLHATAEIYSSIEPQISNVTLNETLAINLDQLSQIVNTSSTASLKIYTNCYNSYNKEVTIAKKFEDCYS